MIRRWRDVPGSIAVEIYFADGKVYDARDDKEVPELASVVKDDKSYELVINFRSTGYYDPGSMYGGWQNLGNPPEGDDERTLDVAYLTCDKQRIELPQDVQQQLLERFQDRVDAETIEAE